MELEKIQRKTTEMAREIEKASVSGKSRKIWKARLERQTCRWEKTGSKSLE